MIELVREVAAMSPGKPQGFVRWCRAFLSWVPHSKQTGFGESLAKIILLACGIRFGKSAVAAARFLYYMFFTPNGRFLNISFSQDQATIVVEMAIQMAMSGPLAGFVLRIRKSPHLTLEFKNGATLQARSADDIDLIRGRPYDGIGADEGALLTRADLETLLGRTIDRKGWLAIYSSPKGRSGCFFEWYVEAVREMKRGNPRYWADTGTTYDNPHMPPEEIEFMRNRYTEDGFRQEVMGEFVDREGATFPAEIVERVFGEDYALPVAPKQIETYPGVWTYPPHNLGASVTAFDLGRKTTVTAGYTFGVSGGNLVGWDRVRLQSAPWALVSRTIEETQAKWKSTLTVDGTGVGDAIVSGLNAAVSPPGGTIFTQKLRAQMILETQKAFQTGAIKMHPSWSEARTDFILHTWKEDAEGRTWDDFDAVIMAVHMTQQMHATLGFSVLG